MAWSYIRLWKLLLDKDMKRIDLAAAAHLTPNTLASLGKNKEVSMETLNKICNQLDCRIEDILEHIPDWKIDRSRTAQCRDFRLRSIFLGTIGHNVFWNFQSLLIFPTIAAATSIDKQKCLHTALAIFRFPINNCFVYLHEFCHLYLYNSTAFSSPQKSRKTAFLQPNPVCDFDPWFYDFGETVMITGSGLKKSYIFRFCIFFRFFDAMILMFLIRFLFDFFWLRGFSPISQLQLFRLFHFRCK